MAKLAKVGLTVDASVHLECAARLYLVDAEDRHATLLADGIPASDPVMMESAATIEGLRRLVAALDASVGVWLELPVAA